MGSLGCRSRQHLRLPEPYRSRTASALCVHVSSTQEQTHRFARGHRRLLAIVPAMPRRLPSHSPGRPSANAPYPVLDGSIVLQIGAPMATSREVSPRRAVEVLGNGMWRPGLLRWWRRDGDRWLAFVDVTHRPRLHVRALGAGRPGPAAMTSHHVCQRKPHTLQRFVVVVIACLFHPTTKRLIPKVQNARTIFGRLIPVAGLRRRLRTEPGVLGQVRFLARLETLGCRGVPRSSLGGGVPGDG